MEDSNRFIVRLAVGAVSGHGGRWRQLRIARLSPVRRRVLPPRVRHKQPRQDAPMCRLGNWPPPGLPLNGLRRSGRKSSAAMPDTCLAAAPSTRAVMRSADPTCAMPPRAQGRDC